MSVDDLKFPIGKEGDFPPPPPPIPTEKYWNWSLRQVRMMVKDGRLPADYPPPPPEGKRFTI